MKTKRLETAQRHLRETCQQLENDVLEMELAMNITRRWSANDESYQNTVQYIAERQYRQALAHLEKLVVQRLFELHKMNLSHLSAYFHNSNDLISQ